MLILVAFIFLSFSNLAVAVCPNGTLTIPSILGSKYNCIFLVQNRTYFVDAETACSAQGGHLISVPNGYVNTFLAGK